MVSESVRTVTLDALGSSDYDLGGCMGGKREKRCGGNKEKGVMLAAIRKHFSPDCLLLEINYESVIKGGDHREATWVAL